MNMNEGLGGMDLWAFVQVVRVMKPTTLRTVLMCPDQHFLNDDWKQTDYIGIEAAPWCVKENRVYLNEEMLFDNYFF